MPSTPQNIATTTTTATVTSDSVSQPMKAQYYAPKYNNAFPDSIGDSNNYAEIANLPIMEITAGKEGIEYIDTPFKSGGTMILVILSFLFIAFSFRKGSKYISMLMHNLLSTKRQRSNIFDDHTVNESQMLTSLIVNYCITNGILLFLIISLYHPEIGLSKNVFYSILGCVAMSLALYLFQLIAYYTLGYVFDDKYGVRSWTEGYNAQISLLGVVLLPFILVMLLYPNTTAIALIPVVIIYFLLRIVFIYKGFRIFFNNLQSIPYFILYLCNVEIVPIILSYAGAIVLCKLIGS